MENEGDSYTNRNWCTGNDNQRLGEGDGRLENRRMSRDNPNSSIGEIDQTTEKSPVDLRRLALTKSKVKDHQLTLV